MFLRGTPRDPPRAGITASTERLDSSTADSRSQFVAGGSKRAFSAEDVDADHVDSSKPSFHEFDDRDVVLMRHLDGSLEIAHQESSIVLSPVDDQDRPREQ